MGVVVLASDSEKGREVAIKLIKPELVSDQRVVHRFVKEAGHLQKLKHPNIVPVLEVSDRAEGPYFVMPYFENGSLAGRIRPGRPLEPEVVIDIATQIAEGLVFAHRHGIIHRDLKPANILLGRDNKSCLADFGLARTMFNDTIVDVERDQLEGTAPYMSPGVAAGNAEDTRCDIYAFGALLYEMLTGDPPYVGSTTSEIRRQILAGPPKPIEARNPAADAGLATVAKGAMARELRDRYADMADVLADLERIKVGKPPVGPHDLSHRLKQRSFSLWVPGGVLLIAAGLWLMWPTAPEKAAAPTPAQTTSAPPAVVTPAPPTNVHPTVLVPTAVDQEKWHASIIAGQPGVNGNADGAGADARFFSPGGIAVDTHDHLYIADTRNYTIRRISRNGEVSTLAGQAGQPGRADGAGNAARFLSPLGIAVDRADNVYVAEFASDTIRKVTSSGDVTTLAGSAGVPGSQDGLGDNAHFRNPWSLAVDFSGNLFVADKSDFTIRLVTPNGRVSTYAGVAGKAGHSDGPGTSVRFRDVEGIAVDGNKVIYVGDAGNDVVRQISLGGLVSTLAGVAGSAGNIDGVGGNARFSNIQGIAADPSGNVYVIDSDTIRRIAPGGVVQTLPRASLSGENGLRIHPTSLTVDNSGNLYLVEAMNDVVWKVTPPMRSDATQHGATVLKTLQ